MRILKCLAMRCNNDQFDCIMMLAPLAVVAAIVWGIWLCVNSL